MRILLVVLLLSVMPVQDRTQKVTRLSKVQDLNEVMSRVQETMPDGLTLAPCGDYLMVAIPPAPNTYRQIYYEGQTRHGYFTRDLAMLGRITVEIDESLETPEVELRIIKPLNPRFYFRMSQKEYARMPCLPNPEKK